MQLNPQGPSLPTIADLRALFVDLDGTLVDSNDAHARAWVQALADQDITRDQGEVRPLIGMGGDQLVPELTGKSDSSELGEALVQGWQDHFKPLIAGLEVLPGARELLEWAREQGLTVVLASSGEDDIVEALLEHAGLTDLIDLRVRSDEVQQTKPEPDILQAALNKAGVQPQQALFVGDTRFDAEAAQKAGVPCVLLRAGGSPDLEEAQYVLANAHELLSALQAATQD
ncbi:HAD family hydrolase [Deinococcus sp. SL84]|uniref:HAD family hydrolase n=1 Tax=Deinococcus sp. SL84 TaxID=2994663 RepID=UPI0022736286|nr:HAD family hydrolase [Deinococcus sp. SL84]MCY1702184.1 HAD family hydrolase [Deinococcus sp. SL84]